MHFNQYSVGGRGPNANNAMADVVNRNPPSAKLVSFVARVQRVVDSAAHAVLPPAPTSRRAASTTRGDSPGASARRPRRRRHRRRARRRAFAASPGRLDRGARAVRWLEARSSPRPRPRGASDRATSRARGARRAAASGDAASREAACTTKVFVTTTRTPVERRRVRSLRVRQGRRGRFRGGVRRRVVAVDVEEGDLLARRRRRLLLGASSARERRARRALVDLELGVALDVHRVGYVLIG